MLDPPRTPNECPPGANPGYFTADVWQRWLAYWPSEPIVAESTRAKKNQRSSLGVGLRHTAGSVNMSEQQVRMKCVYGDDVTRGDVFAVTHMRVVDPEQPPRWVDARSESTYNDYRSCVETEVAEGRLEVEGEKLPWCPHIWKEVATRGRKKRGARVYGFGERGLFAILPSKPSDLSQSSPSNARSYQFLSDDRYQRIVEENVLIRAENERIIAEAECTRLEAERTRLEAQLEAQRSRVTYDQMQAEFRAFMENWRLSNFDTPSSQV